MCGKGNLETELGASFLENQGRNWVLWKPENPAGHGLGEQPGMWVVSSHHCTSLHVSLLRVRESNLESKTWMDNRGNC